MALTRRIEAALSISVGRNLKRKIVLWIDVIGDMNPPLSMRGTRCEIGAVLVAYLVMKRSEIADSQAANATGVQRG